MSRISGFIRLLRPVNGLMMGTAVIVGASLVSVESLSTNVALKLFMGFVTGFTLSSASMTINDYYDQEIDKINEPDRPIPSGLVRPRESLILAGILTAIGITAALFTNLQCLAVAIISWVVSVTYVTKGKKTGLLGNFLVGLCMAIPFVYGSFVIEQNLGLKATLFAAMAFLSGTGREVTKGIVDIEGDKIKGIRTIAISQGPNASAYAASAFFLLAVFLSLLPMPMSLVHMGYIPFIIITDLGFAISSIMLLHDHSREKARKIKNQVMLWMLLGMISFFAGNL